ncbi:MAG TPA: YraN family protein [Burkholderiaceae bacterium]|nr:YraN family protein [Burkholderiaceae bacterium]
MPRAPSLPAARSRATGVRTPRQRAGAAAEEAAARHLQQHGLAVLERNLRFRGGELDLVCRDGGTLVFVEVRLRRDARYGGAAASVDVFKQRRLVRAAQLFLLERYGSRPPACRFDVVAFGADGTIDWIRDAFAVD